MYLYKFAYVNQFNKQLKNMLEKAGIPYTFVHNGIEFQTDEDLQRFKELVCETA